MRRACRIRTVRRGLQATGGSRDVFSMGVLRGHGLHLAADARYRSGISLCRPRAPMRSPDFEGAFLPMAFLVRRRVTMKRRILLRSAGFTAVGLSLVGTALPLIEVHLTVSKDEVATMD